MKYVLFYSNYCKHSNELLIQIKDTHIKNDIKFVCIDNRVAIDGANYSVLENGKRILIPNCINEVPSIILLNNGNNVLKGPEIINYLNQIILKSVSNATHGDMEPACYSILEMKGLSDPYSYLDIPNDELLAKGGGGLRIMHDYCPIKDNNSIETPPEISKPSDYKLSTIDIDTIRNDREKEIPKIERRI